MCNNNCLIKTHDGTYYYIQPKGRGLIIKGRGLIIKGRGQDY